ncbi:Uncharacterized protein APZ42_001536, partial [Daphnia magna]
PKGKETKARRRNDKFIVEGSRRSSRLQARLKVVDCSESDVPSAIVDNKIQRELPIVLCTLCKSTGTSPKNMTYPAFAVPTASTLLNRDMGN